MLFGVGKDLQIVFIWRLVMDLVRGNFHSNDNPVATTVNILYLKQNGCYSGIFKHLLFEYYA
jgi:hypothetical protein